jgi:hypothetical protein
MFKAVSQCIPAVSVLFYGAGGRRERKGNDRASAILKYIISVKTEDITICTKT